MIKHFNTAIVSASGSGSTSKKGSGGALIWVAVLAVAVYAGYKFIENRNSIKHQEQN